MKTVTAALVAVLMLIACGQEQPEATSDTVNPVNAPLVSGRPTIAETEAGATVAVVLEDNTIGLPQGGIGPGPAVITVQNAGTQLHSLNIEKVGGQPSYTLGENLQTGGTATMQAGFSPGTWVAWCPLHVDQPGERVEFTVEAP